MEGSSHISILKVVLNRRELLEEIAAGTDEKRDLQDQLDSSRTTIDRAVRKLETVDILTRQGGRCELTKFGRLVFTRFNEFLATLETLADASDLLSILPEDSNLPMDLLQEADVELTTERAPVAPLSQFTSIPDCDTIRAVLPVLFPQQLQFLHGKASTGSRVEVILHSELLPVVSDTYPDLSGDLRESDTVSVLASSDLPQFGLTIIDAQKVWVSMHHPSGGLRGLLTNTSQPAIESAESVFKSVKEKARLPQYV